MELVTRGQGPSDILLADSTTYAVAPFVSFFLVSHNFILATYYTSCLCLGLLLSSLVILGLVLREQGRNAVALGVVSLLESEEGSLILYLLGFPKVH